jgi:hypothetical protein
MTGCTERCSFCPLEDAKVLEMVRFGLISQTSVKVDIVKPAEYINRPVDSAMFACKDENHAQCYLGLKVKGEWKNNGVISWSEMGLGV